MEGSAIQASNQRDSRQRLAAGFTHLQGLEGVTNRIRMLAHD